MIVEQMLKNAQTPLLHIADVSGSALFQGDCLDIMPLMPDKSVQLILADLPYGTTACKWDTIIPFDALWKQYERIIKLNGAIVLTASQPFTSALVMSNPKMFKHEWIWEKAVGSNFAALKYQPMKEHENILVFGKGTTIYNPIKEERKGSGKQRQKAGYTNSKATAKTGQFIGGIMDATKRTNDYDELRYPSSIQYFNNRDKDRGMHPTQKPLELMKYLISTYSNENDMVLDNTMGSGTTCLAARELNRKFIGIEKEPKYYEIACQRCGF
jgi:site-specific DNA-methyltransferase (adenine-specific)